MKSYIAKLMLQGNPLVRIAFIVCSIIFLSHQDVQATHIVGGDLTYQCLGGNRYRITLTVRRDCLLGAQDAPFDDPASIGLFDLTTGLLITDLNPVGFPN